MIYICSYSGQSGQESWKSWKIFMAWQKNSLHSCGWINQKCQTLNGCDLVGNSSYLRLCLCRNFFLSWLKGYFCVNFPPPPQIEKQMSCVMGIPGPVHNPSCSSPQVLSSHFEVLMFSSCCPGLFVSPLVITLCFTKGCTGTPHTPIHQCCMWNSIYWMNIRATLFNHCYIIFISLCFYKECENGCVFVVYLPCFHSRPE